MNGKHETNKEIGRLNVSLHLYDWAFLLLEHSGYKIYKKCETR
jgi:hypothetical protein